VSGPTQADVDALYHRLCREAEQSGYHLNPDREFVRDLLAGLLVNQQRHGYLACPCRLATGNAEQDRDIVCPCDYRDPDLEQYGCCYCALYVSEQLARGEGAVGSIPERRPTAEERRARGAPATGSLGAEGKGLSHPVWRCNVCGYLCARDHPPGICPICKAKKDRFSRFA
jgi:ferredoxin-thioredoxin reductase catalytic subunit